MTSKSEERESGRELDLEAERNQVLESQPAPEQVEEESVHKVYQEIASHFSSTRYTSLDTVH